MADKRVRIKDVTWLKFQAACAATNVHPGTLLHYMLQLMTLRLNTAPEYSSDRMMYEQEPEERDRDMIQLEGYSKEQLAVLESMPSFKDLLRLQVDLF